MAGQSVKLLVLLNESYFKRELGVANEFYSLVFAGEGKEYISHRHNFRVRRLEEPRAPLSESGYINRKPTVDCMTSTALDDPAKLLSKLPP